MEKRKKKTKRQEKNSREKTAAKKNWPLSDPEAKSSAAT